MEVCLWPNSAIPTSLIFHKSAVVPFILDKQVLSCLLLANMLADRSISDFSRNESTWLSQRVFCCSLFHSESMPTAQETLMLLLLDHYAKCCQTSYFPRKKLNSFLLVLCAFSFLRRCLPSLLQCTAVILFLFQSVFSNFIPIWCPLYTCHYSERIFVVYRVCPSPYKHNSTLTI